MINLLAQQLPLLTFLLVALLLSHKALLKILGARGIYTVWLIVPLSLISFNLPLIFQEPALEVPTLTRYMVYSKTQMESLSQVNWIALVWFTGVCVSLLIAVFSHNNIMAKITLKEQLSTQAYKTLHIPKQLNAYWCNNLTTPVISGIIKPKLLLPYNFQHNYSGEQQSLIVAHEICHFNRNDIYWNLVAFLCVALFWFHPLVWLAYFRFRRDQEISCDHNVLARKQKDSRVNYGKALVKTAQSQARFSLAFSHISFRQYGDKYIMIERINQIKMQQQGSSKLALLIALAACALISLFSYAGNHAHNDVKVTHAKKGEVIKPVLRYEPIYPKEAASAQIEGSVVLKFDISTTGKVANISIIKSKPEGVFDKSAATALAKWQYQTSNQGAKNMLVQLDFMLDDHDSSALLPETERISVSK